MSASAGPGEAAPRPGIADLVEALRAAGFPVGVSEAIDATQLLLTLGERETDLGGPARLRSHLRPVFCKSREEQERFDAIFDDWWAAMPGRRTSPPPAPPPPPPAPPPPTRRLLPALLILLVLVSGAAALVRYYDWRPTRTREAPQPKEQTDPSRPIPAPTGDPPRRDLAQGPAVDRLQPAFRFNVEIRPSWIWLVGLLPLVALLGVSLPALVLSRTRLRRRSEPMFLDPEPLAIEARRLVPPMPPELSDRLARHVRSRGIDIERLARRPQVDVRRTIEATLRNHGIPVLRYAVARIHPCYLLLVDVVSERDPRGRLFFQWAERLDREGLDVEILLLRRRSDERSGAEALMVRPASSVGQGERGWSRLSQVRAPRFGERLVVVSDGSPLVDEQAVWRRDALSAHLHRWRDRALFTPVEPRDWGAREEAIERPESAADPGFIVLPLEESALGAWADLVVTGQLSTVALTDPQRFPGLLRLGGGARLVGAEPPDEATLERLILELRVYLGEIGFHWLAAVAIAPIVRWELTLLLGKAALARLPRLGDERSLSAALAANYRRLVRLPWLQRESMPDWLRLRLLAELSQARQDELRRVVEDLLEKISPRAVPDGIELAFERPPGSDVDRRDALRGLRDGKAEGGDPLYLGYMSGVSPAELVMRAPAGWASWARRMRLPRQPGWRGRMSRLRERARSAWARWAWVDGLPYLGLNQGRALVLLLLALPLVGALVAVGRATPAAPRPAGGLLFTERWHPFVIAAPGADAAAWSPDGRRVVSGGESGTLRIWDAETGAPIGRPLRGHTDRVSSVAWSRDGRRIVSGSLDRTVRLWDAETGASVGAPRRGHESGVLSVAWSTDNQRFVSASAETLRLWDVRSDSPIRAPLVGHREQIRAVAWSPDGRFIASGGDDRTVRIWDGNSGAPTGAPLDGHTRRVSSVAWSPDSRRLVSASADGALRFWSGRDDNLSATVMPADDGAFTSVAWSPDGRRVLSGSANGILRLWDADTYLPFSAEPPEHPDSILSVAWRPDGQRVVSLDGEGTLRFWGTESGTPVGKPLAGTLKRVASMAWSPDGRRIVIADVEGSLGIWDWHTGNTTVIVDLQAGEQPPATTAAWSPDGRRIVRGDMEGRLSVSDATGRPIVSFSQRHGGPIGNVAWSPDGRRIASGSNDSTLRVWDAETGAPIGNPVASDTDQVFSVAWSPDGRRIAWGNENRTVRILDAQTGAPFGRALEGHTASVTAVAWSPDGRRIASGAADGTVRFWDADTGAQNGRPLLAYPPGTPATPARGTVLRIAWSLDGHQVIAASTNGTVRVWDASTRAQVGMLRGSGSMDAVAFGPAADQVAIATTPARAQRPPAAPPSSVEEAKRADAARQQAAPPKSEPAARSTVQIWRLSPSPEPPAPSGVSRLQALIGRHLTVARAGSQPFWWLLGLAFAGGVLALLRAERRVRRALAGRPVAA